MVRIAGSEHIMHDARRKTRWTVELSPFEIGAFTVTGEQIAQLIGEQTGGPRRPATGVSWLRAVRICNAASEWEGLESAYSFDGEQVVWDSESEGYRLPTEAEWEVACRAGSSTPQYGPIREVAWTAADGLRAPQDVGGRLPNLNGMFDTLGNVWEWCWDLFDPERSDTHRAIRGGGFLEDPQSVAAATRRGSDFRSGHGDLGFRFARGARASTSDRPA